MLSMDATGRLMNLQFIINLVFFNNTEVSLVYSFSYDIKKATCYSRFEFFCDTVTLLHHKSHLSWSAHSN